MFVEMLKKEFERVRFDEVMCTYFQENMREACPEVGPVDIKLFLAWKVHILTTRAVDFDSRRGQFFSDSDR